LGCKILKFFNFVALQELHLNPKLWVKQRDAKDLI